jgi:curli production assembly/transport component CsgE
MKIFSFEKTYFSGRQIFTIYRTLFFALISACSVVLASPVSMQQNKQQNQQQDQKISVAEALKLIQQRTREDTESGVVTNQVMTVVGQDFFQHFVNAWRDKEHSELYTLSVRERPSARWGSEVWVEYGQGKIFYARLPIARSAIKQLSENAAEMSYLAILRIEDQKKISSDADIAVDEF